MGGARLCRNPDDVAGGYATSAALKAGVHAPRAFSAGGRHDHGGGGCPHRGGTDRASTAEKRHHSGGYVIELGSWRPSWVAKSVARETREGRTSHRSGGWMT